MLSHLSHVRLYVTLWTVACQSPLSMGFSRQEYWSGLQFPSPGDLPDPGIPTQVSCIAVRLFTDWARGKPLAQSSSSANTCKCLTDHMSGCLKERCCSVALKRAATASSHGRLPGRKQVSEPTQCILSSSLSPKCVCVLGGGGAEWGGCRDINLKKYIYLVVFFCWF